MLRGQPLVVVLAAALAGAAAAADYVRLPASSLRSVLPPDGKNAVASVASFEMRTLPVTNGEFRAFVAAAPTWRRGQVPAIFADENYLAHWPASGELTPDEIARPVTNVSWFAALAFCAGEGARLPSWHEWEVAAAADESRRDARDDEAWRQRILDWYSRPSLQVLPPVGRTPKNVYGVYDLHAVVWEWVEDFNALMVSADNREQGDPNRLKFCGAGASSVADRENYPVLMRLALLSSLEARQTTRNLGFRCVRPLGGPTP